MAKAKRQYVCQNCGSATYRWQGQCTDCGEWNTLVEEAAETVFSAKHDLSRGGRALALETLDAHSVMPERMLCGIAEFDRALGDRKSVVEGQSGSVRVDLGGRRLIKKKK